MRQLFRAEARDLNWNEMQDSQRDAFQKLLGMINRAIKDLPERPLTDAETIRWRNERRASRVGFLVGGRGSGKSSVLVTLLKAMGRTPTDAGFPPELQSLMKVLRSRVVQLDMLDAELVVRSRNLMAAILTRVDAACKQSLAGSICKGATQGLLSPESHTVFQRLQRLLVQASIAWDSEVAVRRPQLDPTQMALESLQHEQAQLSIDDELDQVLHRVAEAYRTNEIHNPLFLLPVDDFDLNPTACVQLLKVIRMISSPRLFFVLLGDLDVSEVVLRLHQSATFVEGAEPILNTPYIAVQPDEVTQQCRILGGNMLRKLIPPSHRVKLSRPTLAEALNFRPLDAQADDLRLHELLDKIPVFLASSEPTERGPLQVLSWHSLREWLLGPGFRVLASRTGKNQAAAPATYSGKLTEVQLRESSYHARWMFRTSLRRLADLWLGFQELVEKFEAGAKRESGAPPSPKDFENYGCLREFLYAECLSLLDEEPLISTIDRQRLLRAFKELPRAGWFLGNIPIEVSTQTYPAFVLGAAQETGDGGPKPQFQFHKFVDWQVAPRPVHQGPPGTELAAAAALEPTTAATLALFHDGVVSAAGHRNAGSFILDNPRVTARWANTVWREGRQEAHVPWPAPPCQSFAAIDRLGFAWNDFLIGAREEALQSAQDAKFAAFVWISAATAVLDFGAPVTCSDVGKPLPWQQLLASIAEPRPEWPERTFQWWRWRAWQISLADFVLPEMDRLLADLSWPKAIREIWQKERHSILQRRRIHLAALWNGSMPGLVEELAPGRIRGIDTDFSVSVESVEGVGGFFLGRTGTPLPPSRPQRETRKVRRKVR